jgi:membrane protein
LIHRVDQHPGYIVLRQLVDLAILLVIFLLLGLSVGAVDALESLLSWLLGARSVALSICSWLLAFLINVLLGSALLLAVPRLRMSFRRWLPPVLFVAVGITLINSVGRYYVVRWERNPAYTVVAGAVGLLIYLYLLNQILLFGAAIAATSQQGRIRDLAAGGAAVSGPATGGPRGSGPDTGGASGSGRDAGAPGSGPGTGEAPGSGRDRPGSSATG